MKSLWFLALLAYLLISETNAFSVLSSARMVAAKLPKSCSRRQQPFKKPPVSFGVVAVSRRVSDKMANPTVHLFRSSAAAAMVLSGSDSDDDSSSASPSERKMRNAKALGKLALAGILGYGYLQYMALVSLATGGYYLFQKTAGNRAVKNGEWITLGGVGIGLIVVRKILTPARFILSMIVSTFLMYTLMNLANGDLKVKDV